MIIYPFIFAIYPILFLYSHNIDEVELSQINIPILCALAGSAALYFILKLILKNSGKAGLCTTLFILIFFYYGHFFDYLERHDIYFPIFRHSQFTATTILIWGYATFFINRSKSNFSKITKPLNIIAGILITINILNIAIFEIKNIGNNQVATIDLLQEKTSNIKDNSTSPDIYFILLDEFASLDTIKEIYHHVNSPLENFLREKNFFIATKSKTDSSNTWHVLPERLNMMEIEKNLPTKKVFNLVLNNKAAKYLKSKGYKYVYISDRQINDGQYINPYSDVNLTDLEPKSKYIGIKASSFESMLIETSILRMYYYKRIENGEIHQKKELLKIDAVKKAIDIQAPKFVFSHHLISHAPFPFGENGEIVEKKDQYDWQNKNIYLGTYIFTENQIIDLVSEILAKSKTPPIIIIQSDHGPRGGQGKNDNPKKLNMGYEWSKVFNAYYFPDQNYKELSDSIDPINTFPIIFNQYFNEDFKLIK